LRGMTRQRAVNWTSAGLALLCCLLRMDAVATADHRTMYGVARGQGRVVISPQSGSQFDSPRSTDVAFACSSAPLPDAYRVSVHIENIDIRYSGARFGIFDEAVRFGGDNDSVNDLTKLAVSFHEIRGQRRIYVSYYDRDGVFWCWDGRVWQRNFWRPAGANWSVDTGFTIVIEKNAATFSCEVRTGRAACVKTAPVPITQVRRCGRPDYIAFGDMVTDYVNGSITVSSITVEELAMTSLHQADLEHVVIREATEGRYAMYGGLTRLQGDELICFYKVGSRDPETGSPWTVRDETIVWTRSPDNGRTWEQTERVIYADRSTRQEICCGNAFVRADGTLLHPFYILNPNYEERAKADNWSRLHLAVSADRGQSWETPRLHVPLGMPASFGGFLKLSDGTLLLSVYGTKETGTFRHQAGVMRSGDEGRTWEGYSLIGARADPDGGPARLNETGVAELADGSLVSMSRTQYSGFPLYRGRSTDRGRTWSVGPSDLTGLCPTLAWTRTGPPEGTLVLAYHDRWGKHADKGGMYVSFSFDAGATWAEPTWISPGAYPCLLEVAPGRFLCSYYRDSTLLRASLLRVPFPPGLQAATGLPGRPDTCGIRVAWQAYRGDKAAAYSYQVHRSDAGSQAEAECVARCLTGNTFVDTDVEPGRAYTYRVTAVDGNAQVGASWRVTARAGSAE